MIDYTKYDIQDFIKDERFRDWVLSPTPELDSFWESWLERYPDKVPVLVKAKAFILSLDYDVTSVSEQRKVKLLKAVIDKSQQVEREQAYKRNSYGSYGIAASAALLLAAFLSLFLLQEPDMLNPLASKKELLERETAFGEKMNIRLPDGTEVKLNAGSTIRFPEHFGATREVYLAGGEAFFEVVHDSARPFLVHTEGVEVKVMGTSFNVNTQQNQTRVALVSGKVAVWDSSADTLTLTPAQMAVCENGEIKKSSYNYVKEVGWKDGLLVFEKADLPEIAQKLEAWYGCEVILKTQKSLPRKFSGQFKDLPLKQVLEGLSFTSALSYTLEDKKVLIDLK